VQYTQHFRNFFPLSPNTHPKIEIEYAMGLILLALGGVVGVLSYLPQPTAAGAGVWLPTTDNAAKREFEVWALGYSLIWIGVFGVVVATSVYKQFTANSYMYLCVSLALPYLLQPVVYPLPAEKNLPLHMRYSFKANLWIAIFSFIGNYWYTHYFYSVLEARYTFPSHRLNNVPIALFFATHFYFVFYHTASNMLLRKVETSYRPGPARRLLFWTVVCSFAYFTAFMESFSISSFEHYSFNKPKSEIYSWGSAFYGIYFLVSYPVFYRLDEKVSSKDKMQPHSLFQTIMEVMGSAMIVLLLLDFCRIAKGVDLNIPGMAFCENSLGQQCRAAGMGKTATRTSTTARSSRG